MELSSLISVVSFLLFLFVFLKTIAISKHARSYSHIPGPKKHPLIGDLHLMLGNTIPHRLFRDLAAKYGPLVHLQLGELHSIIISSMELAKEVFTTHDINFANRPHSLTMEMVIYNYSDIGTAPYGDYWRHVRKILTLEILSAKRVLSFRPIREEENKKMVKLLASHSQEGSPANLSKIVLMLSYDIITRISVGARNKDQETIVPLMHDLSKLMAGFGIADVYPSIKWLPWVTGKRSKLKQIRRQTDRILGSIIEQHREAKHDDSFEYLVDVLLKFQDDGSDHPLTDDNIKALLMGTFMAASDTTPIVVEWAMSLMVKKPSTLKKAQDEVRKAFDNDTGYVVEEKVKELEYLKLVIKETLRLHPPGPLLIPRMNKHKCEINGCEIPARTTLFINVWAMGRDPKYWGNDAEEFKPERFVEKVMDFKGTNYEYLPFGSGRRSCAGLSFGVANVEFVLATLLYHFDWMMPSGIKNEDLDMTEDFGFTVGRKHPLQLIPTLARPLKD